VGVLAGVGAVAVIMPIALVMFAWAFAVSIVIGIVAAVRGVTPLAPGQNAVHAAVQAARDRLVALPDSALRDSLLARLLRQQMMMDQGGPTVLLPAGLAGGYAAGFAMVVLLIAITMAVRVMLTWLVVLAVRTTAGALRWFETITLALGGITTECGICHQRLIRPAFVCLCGRIHHDLVPGSHEVFRRTCECGHRLPTLLVTGKRALHARCGLCGAQLPGPVQSMPSVHLPVVGGTAAGKTVFTHAAVAHLGGDHFATVPPVCTFRWEDKHLRRLVYLYDAAGDVFERAEHLAVSAFLDLADGLIFVVDPFSLGAVSARADPKTVLDGVIETLTEFRGTAWAIPLAVVITKADSLPRHPYTGVAADPFERSAAARQWLLDHDRVDLVNSAQNDFSRVRYFVVGNGDAHDHPASPVRWLLDR
jgi:hypothetical protein